MLRAIAGWRDRRRIVQTAARQCLPMRIKTPGHGVPRPLPAAIAVIAAAGSRCRKGSVRKVAGHLLGEASGERATRCLPVNLGVTVTSDVARGRSGDQEQGSSGEHWSLHLEVSRLSRYAVGGRCVCFSHPKRLVGVSHVVKADNPVFVKRTGRLGARGPREQDERRCSPWPLPSPRPAPRGRWRPARAACDFHGKTSDRGASGGSRLRAAEPMRVRVLRWFTRGGPIEPDDAREMRVPRSSAGPTAASRWMPQCASARRIAPGLSRHRERLLRDCARPPFALERMELLDDECTW
jgi:hypothetical protein